MWIELKVYTDIIYNNLDVLSAYPMLEKNSKDNKTTPELESIKELKNKINQNPQKNFLMFYHLLGGFEEFMFCSNMSIQLNQGYLLSRYSDLEEGKDLIAQTSLPIVFCQTKLIKMLYNQ
nr:hypothetical protein A5866_000769 [Enterococcus sp. 12C11_DIV0727]